MPAVPRRRLSKATKTSRVVCCLSTHATNGLHSNQSINMGNMQAQDSGWDM